MWTRSVPTGTMNQGNVSPATGMISVEFYGTARLAARVGRCEVVRASTLQTLADLLRQVERQIPAAAGKLIQANRLNPTLTANLDGTRFSRNPDERIDGIESVLLMSIDVGG